MSKYSKYILLGSLLAMLISIYFMNIKLSILFYIFTLIAFAIVILPYLINGRLTINLYELIFIYLSLALVIFNALVNELITYYHFVPLLLIGFYLFIKKYNISISEYLLVNNIHFIVYLILSLLVYMNIISIERDMNIFTYQIGGFNYHTMIGFYGSTASIDAYAMFTGLVNLFHNKNKFQKYVIFIVCCIISFSTLRFTPVLSLILVVLVYFTINSIKIKSLKKLLVLVFILISIAIPYILHLYSLSNLRIVPSELIVYVTNGRSILWNNIILEFKSLNIGLNDILFGLGRHIEVDTGWSIMYENRTTNPHNSYLNIFTLFGFMGLIIVSVLFIKESFKFINKGALFIVLYIITISISNSGILNYYNIFIIVYLFVINNKYTKTLNHKRL